LGAVVPLAEETRAEDVASENKEDGATSGERVAEVRDAGEAGRAVAQRVAEVDVVDEEKAK